MAANSDAPIESLGARIKRLRAERKLSQDRLAIESHIDQSGLSKFERGRDRSMGEIPLRRIAAVLKVSFEELIDGTDFQQR
jgi:transcriptional regulator with XRE-family HTH domain